MPEEENSKFNIAVAYLMRLNKMLGLCSAYSMQGDLHNWFNTIRAVYREASIYIDEKDEHKFEGTEETNVKLEEPLVVAKKNATFGSLNLIFNNTMYIKKYPGQMAFLLHHLEIKIRRYVQSKSILVPKHEDDGGL